MRGALAAAVVRARRDGDDLSRGLRGHHAAGRRLAREEHAAHVRLDHAVPLLLRHLEDGTVRIDPRVRDGDGHGTERALGRRDELLDGRRVADVDGVREHAVRCAEALRRAAELARVHVAERLVP